MSRVLEELKERRFWRVLVAYPSITFVLLQAVEFFINNYDLDGRYLTATILAAIVLLPAAMIWNWRHGEEGVQAFIRSEKAVYATSLMLVVLVVGWYWKVTPAGHREQLAQQMDLPVIAVMPFEARGEGADLQYLGDGIAESLINWLSTVPEVKVVAKTASFRSREMANDPKALANVLGADQVIIGSLEVLDGQVETSVSLIDTRDESQLWGERFGEDLNETIYLERSIVAAIQQRMNFKLGEATLSASGGTDNPLAYQAYQRGHFLIQSTEADRVQEGLDELRAAIRADPKFGLPYADIADALSQMLFYGVTDNATLLGEARSAAYSAVALAPELPEAYTALAAVHQYIDFDWQAADTAYEKAIALNPQNPASFHRYADFLWVTLRFHRAQEMAARAIEIDPLDGSAMHAVGISYLFDGKFAEAASAFGEWNRFHPQSRWSYVKHAVALSLNGQCDQAAKQASRVLELIDNQPSTLMLSWLAWGYHVCGSEALYAQARQRLQAEADENPESLEPGLIYYFALEGQGDLALAVYQRCVETHCPLTLFTQVLVPGYLGWPDMTEGETGAAYLALIRTLNFPPNELID